MGDLLWGLLELFVSALFLLALVSGCFIVIAHAFKLASALGAM